MKTLQFQKAVSLDDLHSELLAAVPSIRPVPGSDGRSQAVLILQGGAEGVTLYVPDDADEAAISEVVQAHDPLAAIQAARIAELNAACEASILGRFTSSALGAAHEYAFDMKKQTNMNQQMAMMNANQSHPPVDWPTEDAGDLAHTRDQFIALCNSAETFKWGYIKRYRALKAQVLAATTAAEVAAIVW